MLSTEFTEVQKIAILIANPQGTQQGGIVGLLQRNYFPENLIDLIVASWITEGENTYRAELEMQMSQHHTDMVQAANHWVKLLHSDTVPANLDTLRMVWQQVRTPAARYAEAALLLGQGEYEAADELITDMTSEHALSTAELGEQGRMIKYMSILADAAADSRNAYQLDSLEVAVLDSMVIDHCDRPSAWAGNLLCAVYRKCHAPCTGGEVAAPKVRRSVVPEQAQAGRPTALRLQPNPARDLVSMLYHMPGNAAAAKLVVCDSQGRAVQEFTVGGEQGQVSWTVQRVAPGVYSVSLLRNGKTISTERLIIQP